MTFTIRPLGPDDEDALRAAHAAMEPPGFFFAFHFDEDTDYAEYVARLERERRGEDLPAGRVASTFEIAVEDGVILGRVSIRHELNERLLTEGGHVGYGVVPAARGRGVARALMDRALEVCAQHGIERALLICDADNAPSRHIIESSGGVFEEHAGDLERGQRRYWVPTS